MARVSQECIAKELRHRMFEPVPYVLKTPLTTKVQGEGYPMLSIDT
jgi:hypothetical protein